MHFTITGNMGELMPSLLDSGSIVSLVCHNHLNCYFRPRLGPAGGSDTKAYTLFDLTNANGWHIPLSRYVELNIEFFYFKVPRAGTLVSQNSNVIPYPIHSTKLPGIVGWNLVKVAYQESTQNMVPRFSKFGCLEGVDHLLFSQPYV